MHAISQKAINHIIAEEVSSPAYYERHYRKPEWPGGASGVTVGNGYDLGYASKEKIKQDFGGRVSPQMLAVMQSCSGVKGGAASQFLRSVKNQIDIPWSVAYAVFMERDVPQWTATLYRSLGPNCDLLTPTCLGVEVGLIYNRGAGGFNMAGDRYTEMRQIKAAVADKRFPAIPAYHDSMARIWEGTSVAGVAGRRHREAALFREGMKETGEIKTVTVPKSEPDPDVIASNRADERARTPQPKTTPTQNGTTAGTAGAPGAAAKAAGFSNGDVAMVVVISILAAAIIWFAWYRNRNPTGGFEPA